MSITWSSKITYGGNGDYEWKNHEGVYIIAREDDDGALHAIYVGQENIPERMKHHESKNEENECLYEYMKVRKKIAVYSAKIENTEKRNIVEYNLYYAYGGKSTLCNEISPVPTKLVYVNIPFDKIDINN